MENAECDLLDCTMDLYKQNSRKKIDEKPVRVFEEFAFRCINISCGVRNF
ncbi:MAG: hypothetical protein NC078_10540 [Ruminococcus sp.]|nr:hypothetical protein [Ruminococcus sp.]